MSAARIRQATRPLAKKLRAIRLAGDLSQTRMLAVVLPAADAGQRSRVSQWEKAVREPTRLVLHRYAQFAHISLEDLLIDERELPPHITKAARRGGKNGIPTKRGRFTKTKDRQQETNQAADNHTDESGNEQDGADELKIRDKSDGADKPPGEQTGESHEQPKETKTTDDTKDTKDTKPINDSSPAAHQNENPAAQEDCTAADDELSGGQNEDSMSEDCPDEDCPNAEEIINARGLSEAEFERRLHALPLIPGSEVPLESLTVALPSATLDALDDVYLELLRMLPRRRRPELTKSAVVNFYLSVHLLGDQYYGEQDVVRCRLRKLYPEEQPPINDEANE